jgi:hypothetical protein
MVLWSEERERTLPSRLSHRAPFVLVGEQTLESGGDLFRTRSIQEESRLSMQDGVRQRAYACGHDRPTGSHSLEGGAARLVGA